MNKVHRIAVSGAFGSLVAATAVASAAFACTPDASMQIEQGGQVGKDAVVRADWEFDVHVAHFYDKATVEVDWVAPDGTRSRLAAVPGPRFTLDNVWAPAAQPTAVNAPYRLEAKQVTAEGTKVLVSNVHIKAAAAPAADQPPVNAPPATPNETPAPNPAPSQAPVAAPSPGRAPSAAPAPAAAAPAAGPQAEATTTAAPAAAQPAAAPASAAPVVTGPILVGDDAVTPAPATGDLWSGVSGEATSSLLGSGAAPLPEQGTSPAGAVLLGFGVLALAGTAVVSGRRQLAVRRATR